MSTETKRMTFKRDVTTAQDLLAFLTACKDDGLDLRTVYVLYGADDDVVKAELHETKLTDGSKVHEIQIS